ncbi:MAG: HEAT repeat domain-containing protein [Elusimicrobia bacterium]|nr:HEAT repeat domain-containing protein [Elusimicrobiota bacterium]
MKKCTHCGRSVLEGAECCPYCRKNSKPAPTPEESAEAAKKEGSRFYYRWHISPKADSSGDQAKKLDKADFIVQALTLGPASDRDRATELVLSMTVDATDPLIGALGNSNTAGREHVAVVLGRLRAAKAVDALVSALDDPERTLRFAAAWALYRIGDMDAVPSLIRALRTSDAQIRRYFVYVLGAMGDRRAIGPVTQMLRDSNSEVRMQAILSLACLEGRRASASIKGLRKDAEVRVRAAAKETLNLLGAGSFMKNPAVIFLIAVLILGICAGFVIYRKNSKKLPQFPSLFDVNSRG